MTTATTILPPILTRSSTLTLRETEKAPIRPILTPKTPRQLGAFLPAAERSPIALSPTITVRAATKRARAASTASTASTSSSSTTYSCHHRLGSPRSPEQAKTLFEHALTRAENDTCAVTDEIIARQSEILARKHDIAVWQRKIHAAERLISGLQEQVDCLVKDARQKQTLQKELASQRDAMLTVNVLSEKEWNALGSVLTSPDPTKTV